MSVLPFTMLLTETLPSPVWATLHLLPDAPPLEADASADVCVVGAGVAGLTTALLLAREGADVILLDAGQPGGGESSRGTAHLCTAVDDRYYNLARWHGREGAILAAQSHRAAIGRVEGFVEQLGLQCDFRRVNGYLFASDPAQDARLDDELFAARAAGLLDTELRAWPGGDGPRCLSFPRQAQLSPWPYLRGLHDEFLRLGGRVHGFTRMRAPRPGRELELIAAHGPRVRAGAVVWAATPPTDSAITPPRRMAARRTHAIALDLPAGAVPMGLYWDSDTPRRQARVAPSSEPDRELLIVGGESHPAAEEIDSEACHARLAEWAAEFFPTAGTVLHAWSGRSFETMDGLAILGRVPGEFDNLYVAAGDSGLALTHGTIGGMIISDLIAKRPNPWARLYDPARR